MERDLTVINLEKNIIKYIFNRSLKEDKSFIVITANEKDALVLDKEIVKHMYTFNGVKPSVKDFKLMGYTLFIMRTKDIDEKKWVMTIGENFN
jgi:hypothetical protein